MSHLLLNPLHLLLDLVLQGSDPDCLNPLSGTDEASQTQLLSAVQCAGPGSGDREKTVTDLVNIIKLRNY